MAPFFDPTQVFCREIQVCILYIWIVYKLKIYWLQRIPPNKEIVDILKYLEYFFPDGVPCADEEYHGTTYAY